MANTWLGIVTTFCCVALWMITGANISFAQGRGLPGAEEAVASDIESPFAPFQHQSEPPCPHNYTQLLEELLKDYDKRLRPNYGGPSVNVQLGMYVENIFSVDETKMEISMTIFVRQLWEDPRLKFDGDSELVLKGEDINLFWSPDLFFLYEIKAWTHEVTVLNTALYIFPGGQMFKSQRLSVVTGCQMELHKFPLDDQKCNIQLLSYAYTVDHLTLEIADDEIILDPEIRVPSFHLQKVDKYETIKTYAMGDYSCAGITFHFHRYWQAYMLTVYLPSYLLVIISWLSFFIDAKSAPARVSLGVTTVLTMTTMSTSLLNSLPQVTYTKSIDIWLAACLVFIFAALVEYAVASQLNCREEAKQHKRTEQWRHSIVQLSTFSSTSMRRHRDQGVQKRGIHSPGESSDMDSKSDLEAAEEADLGLKPNNDLLPLWMNLGSIKHGISVRCTSHNLDYHARWLFFVLFAIFNVTYWTITF